MQVFFCPTSQYCSALDTVNANTGCGTYSGMSLEQFQEKYGEVSIVDETVSIAHDRAKRITEPKEIDEESFHYLLEVLPPCKWSRSADAEAFHISERITYDIVTWAVRIGSSHYRFDDTCTMAASDAIRKVSVMHFAKEAEVA